MTAFTDDQRAQVRKYLGYSRLFINSNPILESAMTAVEQLNDGGSTFTAIVNVLVQLAAVEAQISSNMLTMIAGGSAIDGELTYDPIRGDYSLRRVGQALINQIAIPLATSPVVSYFFPMRVDPTGEVGPRV